MDCEYKMGDGGEICAWSPGACKSWCRSNSRTWSPTVLDIMDEINFGSYLGFGVHIDVLNPKMFPSLVSHDSQHEAALCSEAMIAEGLDGVFGDGSLCCCAYERTEIARGSKCSITLSGLTGDSASHPPPDVVRKWDNWENLDSSEWKERSVQMSPTETPGLYSVSRIQNATSPRPSATQSKMPRTDRIGALNTIASAMGDDMPEVARFAEGKIFYNFECSTYPWTHERRSALAATLDMLTKEMPAVVSRSGRDVWTFSPMGPKMTVRGGNIHVSMRRPPPAAPRDIAWGGSARCILTVPNHGPHVTYAPIEITVTTTW